MVLITPPDKQETKIVSIDKQKTIEKSKDFDIDGFLAKRQEFIEKVNTIMVEGKDYHIIKGKKSMAKGGAEKIANIFGWQAEFKKDTESLEMLQGLKGWVVFVCNLTKDNKYVGQGRGAATLGNNNNDPNKTIKMAQKSGFIDAVLRASGLSDFYTQDLEDMSPETIDTKQMSNKTQTQYNKQRSNYTSKPASEKQKRFIKRLIKEKDVIIDQFIKDYGKNIAQYNMTTAKKAIDYLLTLPNREKKVDTAQAFTSNEPIEIIDVDNPYGDKQPKQESITNDEIPF